MKNLILASLVLIFIGCSDSSNNNISEKENLIDKSANALKDGVDSVVGNADVTKDKIDKIAKSSNDIVEEVMQKSSAVIDSVKSELVIDAKSIYSACASCHGTKGERKALNVSNLLQGQSKNEIIQKLNGYKDGTYGGAMSAVMSSQVALLSKDKIEALAEYISKL